MLPAPFDLSLSKGWPAFLEQCTRRKAVLRQAQDERNCGKIHFVAKIGAVSASPEILFLQANKNACVA